MAAVGGKDVFFVISTIIITVYSIWGIRITKLNAHLNRTSVHNAAMEVISYA